jgi:hypothetical protein
MKARMATFMDKMEQINYEIRNRFDFVLKSNPALKDIKAEEKVNIAAEYLRQFLPVYLSDKDPTEISSAQEPIVFIDTEGNPLLVGAEAEDVATSPIRPSAQALSLLDASKWFEKLESICKKDAYEYLVKKVGEIFVSLIQKEKLPVAEANARIKLLLVCLGMSHEVTLRGCLIFRLRIHDKAGEERRQHINPEFDMRITIGSKIDEFIGDNLTDFSMSLDAVKMKLDYIAKLSDKDLSEMRQNLRDQFAEQNKILDGLLPHRTYQELWDLYKQDFKDYPEVTRLFDGMDVNSIVFRGSSLITCTAQILDILKLYDVLSLENARFLFDRVSTIKTNYGGDEIENIKAFLGEINNLRFFRDEIELLLDGAAADKRNQIAYEHLYKLAKGHPPVVADSAMPQKRVRFADEAPIGSYAVYGKGAGVDKASDSDYAANGR